MFGAEALSVQPTANAKAERIVARRKPRISDIRPALVPATIAPTRKAATAQLKYWYPWRLCPTLGMIVAVTSVSDAFIQTAKQISRNRGSRPSPRRSTHRD
jgi:hypothetical protein